MADHWTLRAPEMLRDETGPNGELCPTPMDRRWLWRLEGRLALCGDPNLRALGDDLRQYLHETCEHYWRPWAGDDQIPAHQQCLWCSDVEWAADVQS